MPTTTAVPLVWTSIQKILFRFITCFFVLWIFPVHFVDSVVSSLPANKPAFLDTVYEFTVDKLVSLYTDLFNALLSAVQATNKIHPYDSYSEWSSYAFLIMTALLALVGCCIWSLVDRGRKNYNLLYHWLYVFVRYFLAVTMLVYGFSKVFCWQMAPPTLSNLVTMMGDYWPQKLAWNYMGYSKTFQIFCGLGEVIGGLLLFWRRTTLVGSLVLIPIITTVFMMNISFDIDVKTESFSYLLMSMFLLFPYRRQLLNPFIKNNVSETVYYSVAIKNAFPGKALFILKYCFIVMIVAANILSNQQNIEKYRNPNKRSPLYGIYNVQHFIRNHDTIPLLITNTSIWKQMIIDEYGLTIKKMNDTCSVYMARIDTLAHTLKVRSYNNLDSLVKSDWHYEKNGELLSLNGKYRGDSVQVLLKWYDHNNMRLPSWGFQWMRR